MTDTIASTTRQRRPVTPRNIDEKCRVKPERGPGMPARVVTAREAQSFLRIGRTTLWALIRAGELKAFRAPGRRRLLFDIADLHGALDAWRSGQSARRHTRVLRRLAR
jgi:excisionase family DNA binding protein